MTAAKETVDALRRHAATWVEGSIPHKLLTMVADVLQDFCDQDPDWHLQLADHPDNVHDRDAALCMCGHPRVDHVHGDGACLAYHGGDKKKGECACRVFGLQDPPMQKPPADGPLRIHVHPAEPSAEDQARGADPCTCGHDRAQHFGYDGACAAFVGEPGKVCDCGKFTDHAPMERAEAKREIIEELRQQGVDVDGMARDVRLVLGMAVDDDDEEGGTGTERPASPGTDDTGRTP